MKIVIYVNEDNEVVSVAADNVFVSVTDWVTVHEGQHEYTKAQASPLWPGPLS